MIPERIVELTWEHKVFLWNSWTAVPPIRPNPKYAADGTAIRPQRTITRPTAMPKTSNGPVSLYASHASACPSWWWGHVSSPPEPFDNASRAPVHDTASSLPQRR